MDDLGLKEMIFKRTSPDLRVGDRVRVGKKFGTVVWTNQNFNPGPDFMCRIAKDGESVPMYFDLAGLEGYQVEIIQEAS